MFQPHLFDYRNLYDLGSSKLQSGLWLRISKEIYVVICHYVQPMVLFAWFLLFINLAGTVGFSGIKSSISMFKVAFQTIRSVVVTLRCNKHKKILIRVIGFSSLTIAP